MERPTTTDLTPRERIVLFAACRQADLDDGRGRPQVIYDPGFTDECEHLTELGLFERVEVDLDGGGRELAGYRLSAEAVHAHLVQNELEDAQESRN